MSMTSATPTLSTSRIVAGCSNHPGNSCIELTLPGAPEGERLNFVFVTLRNPGDVAQVSVIQDLLLQCKPYRAPSGYLIVDTHTAHFHYPVGSDFDIIFEAHHTLSARLERHLQETCKAFRRDPQTNLVWPR